ncbi:MAG: GntR family transcriptional regulator [Desulfobacteraceae bacterium]|nr:MAG: GntR family transcriptional regulator [Desulfobacteraceae bacterium]
MLALKSINEIKPSGLGDQVARALAEAILEGEFKGGDQLLEMELQAHFGISRSPLREAFRELEKQGLVVIVPRKGTYVKRITRKDIEEHFPVRAELEGLAARLAASHINQTALDVMGDLLEKMRDAVRSGDTKTYYSNHLLFHETFINLAGNELLLGLLKNLRMQSLWHRFSYQYYQEDLRKAFEVHGEILDLFRASPPVPEAVGRKVAEHIHVALERFLTYLDDYEQG